MINDAEFLTAAQVRAEFGGVSKMWIERRMATAGFPKPVTFGTTRRYWRISDVDSWSSPLPSELSRSCFVLYKNGAHHGFPFCCNVYVGAGARAPR